jgi:hypothetical protein
MVIAPTAATIRAIQGGVLNAAQTGLSGSERRRSGIGARATCVWVTRQHDPRYLSAR